MKQYVVDAFTREVFRGNPAAVCVMKDWLPDEMMQKIAIENQLSETAYVILRFYEPQAETVSFTTLSGVLTVTKKDGRYEMAFPSYDLKEVPEDPVCGSGHCHIFPYWAKVLGKQELLGWQASARGGAVYGRMEGDQVILGGEAVLFSEAEIYPEGN